MRNTSITSLSNECLLARTVELAQRERRLTLSVIDHLVEVDRRRLYAGEGCRSMFAYCTERLGYSASAADRRICAARAVRRFPRVRRLLERRALTLSTLAVVARQLTKENCSDILDRVCDRSARDAEKVLAEIRGVVPVRERIRPVIALRVRSRPAREKPRLELDSSNSGVAERKRTPTETDGGEENRSRVGSKTPEPPERREDTRQEVATERRYRFEFYGSGGFLRKYQRAVALLSNSLSGRPGIESVFEAVLDEYIDRHDPGRRAARRARRSASRPGAKAKRIAGAHADAPAASRHVPQAVHDEVFVRDGGQCTFVSQGGKRCTATQRLEVDHIFPFAMGGTHCPENLRLLCATHNALMAQRSFGESHMERFRKRE